MLHPGTSQKTCRSVSVSSVSQYWGAVSEFTFPGISNAKSFWVIAVALIHEPFQPHGWVGPSKPDLRWILRQHSRMVKMAQTQSINFIPAVPNTACYIPNGWTASASQWTPDVWTEVKERPEVTRDGNSWVAYLNTSTLPLACFGCIEWQPIHLT